jgi:hypothetical protein
VRLLLFVIIVSHINDRWGSAKDANYSSRYTWVRIDNGLKMKLFYNSKKKLGHVPVSVPALE